MADTPAVTYIPWPIAHTPAPLENGQPVAGRHPAEYLGPGVLSYIGSEFHLMAELNPQPFDPENSRRFRGDLVHRDTYFSGNITFSFEADEDYLYFTAHVFLTWQEPSDRTYARARVDLAAISLSLCGLPHLRARPGGSSFRFSLGAVR